MNTKGTHSIQINTKIYQKFRGHRINKHGANGIQSSKQIDFERNQWICPHYVTDETSCRGYAFLSYLIINI